DRVSSSSTSRWTVSWAASNSIMRRKMVCTCGTRSGQVTGSFGHVSQVAAWRCHSAGMRKPSAAGRASGVIAEPQRERSVGVDAAIAQERPVLARLLDLLQVAFDDQRFFLVRRGLGDDAAERIGDEGLAPERQLPFLADAIHGDDEDAV